jgi:hypothetical protein
MTNTMKTDFIELGSPALHKNEPIVQMKERRISTPAVIANLK